MAVTTTTFNQSGGVEPLERKHNGDGNADELKGRLMNGYLVELCTSMDDIALGLFTTRWAALEFAKVVEPDLTREVCELYRMDFSTPVLVRMVTFKDGKPYLVEVVRIFDEDDGDDDAPDFVPDPDPALSKV